MSNDWHAGQAFGQVFDSCKDGIQVPVGPVIGHCDTAVLALLNIAAVGAKHSRIEPPPVENRMLCSRSAYLQRVTSTRG